MARAADLKKPELGKRTPCIVSPSFGLHDLDLTTIHRASARLAFSRGVFPKIAQCPIAEIPLKTPAIGKQRAKSMLRTYGIAGSPGSDFTVAACAI